MCAALPLPAPAQRALEHAAYPARPVRMVIAFAPGGGTDIVGRIIGLKARVLLMLALTRSRARDEIQRIMLEY